MRIKTMISLALVVAILLVASSVFYYLVIFIPARERLKTEQQDKERVRLETLLDTCLVDAETKFNDFWNKMCKEQNLKEDCSLPKYNADSAKEYLKEWKDECFKKYPQ